MLQQLLDHGADKTALVENMLPADLCDEGRVAAKQMLRLKRSEAPGGGRAANGGCDRNGGSPNSDRGGGSGSSGSPNSGNMQV